MDNAFLARLTNLNSPVSVTEVRRESEKFKQIYRDDGHVEIPIKTGNEEDSNRFVSYTKKEPDIETFHVKIGEPAKIIPIIQPFSDKFVKNGMIINTDVPIVRSGLDTDIPRVSPLKLEMAYISEGMVNNWINRLVEYFLSARPKIVCDNPEDQKIMDEWSIKVNFRDLLKMMFQHKYVHGNAVWRWLTNENGKKIWLDFIDPKEFDALRDSMGRIRLTTSGEPVGYIQYVKVDQPLDGVPEDRLIQQLSQYPYQSGKGIRFDPNEVIHFRLNRIGDNWWGIGMIEPIYNFIVNKKNGDQGYAESIQRVGYPRTVASVGDDNHPPTSQQIDDVWEELQGLHEKSQLVVPYYVKFYMLESKKAATLKANLDYFIDGIVAGLGGPKSLITGGGEDTNRATLQDQKMWLERSLKMEQEDSSDDIIRRVFYPLSKELGLSKVPRIVWQEVSMESMQNKVERVVELIKVGTFPFNDPKLRSYLSDLEDIPLSPRSLTWAEAPQPIPTLPVKPTAEGPQETQVPEVEAAISKPEGK